MVCRQKELFVRRTVQNRVNRAAQGFQVTVDKISCVYLHFRLMRMHEHGIAERENTRMYTKKPRCIGHTGNFITASLVDIKPAALILLWGYLIAFTGLLIEFSIKRIQMRKSRET